MKYGKIIEGNYIYEEGDDLSQVEKITGDIYICKGAKISFPALKSNGGGISVYKGAEISFPENLIKNDKSNNAKQITKEFNFNCFLELGFLFADGILAKILNVKNNNIFKIQIVGKTTTSYCVSQDNTFSHGDTLKEAFEALIYKFEDVDTSEY